MKYRKLDFFKLKILIKKGLGYKGFSQIKGGPNSGFFFFVNQDTNLEYLTGEYEKPLTKILMKHVGSGSVFFDIGAHFGYYSLMASRLSGGSGRVYAFEPSKANYQILRKNVHRNHSENVSTFELAVSDFTGEIEFSNGSNSYANTVVKGSPIFTESDIVKVPCMDIDHFVNEQQVNKVDFVKIDIEGHELNALKGAESTLRNYRPAIYLATHDNHCAGISEKCISYLHNLGYKSKRVSPKTSTSQMIDFFFVHEK